MANNRTTHTTTHTKTHTTTDTKHSDLKQRSKSGIDHGLIEVIHGTKAKTLSISKANIDDARIEEFISFINPWLKAHPDTTTLNLCNNLISDKGAEQLAVLLQQNPSITTLNLQSNKISNKGVNALITALNTITDRSIELDLTLNAEISQKGINQLKDFAMRRGSSHSHAILFSPYVYTVPNSSVPTLEELAHKALLSQGLHKISHNGVKLQKDTSPEHRSQAALFLDHAMLLLLMQAAIDNDVNTVKKMLDKNPSLLLLKPSLLLLKSSKPSEIESKLTWQRFNVENESILSIAVKRNQLKMIEVFLPYINQLDQTEFKAAKDVLSQWKYYEPAKKNREKYVAYAKFLVSLFEKETFPNKLPNGNGDRKKLSVKTESAIAELMPKEAIILDHSFNIEQILLELYRYKEYSRPVENILDWDQNLDWDQKVAFCTRLIGLVQSLLQPEISEILCEGMKVEQLNDLIRRNSKHKIEMSSLAHHHKLKDGEHYYRPTSDSHSGLGFDFCVNKHGNKADVCAFSQRSVLEKAMLLRDCEFYEILHELKETPNPEAYKHKSQGNGFRM